MVAFRQELTIKPYGDTDVALQFKTHDQNLQVCLKWETKIMLFSHQNKEKHFKRLETTFYRREIKIEDRKFLNSTFFLLPLHYRLAVTFLIGISRKSAVSLNV